MDLSEKSIAIIIPDFDYGGEEKRAVFFANGYLPFFKNVYLFSPNGESNVLLDKKVKHIILNPRKISSLFQFLKIIKNKKIEIVQGHKRATLPFLLAAEKVLGTKSVFNFDNIYLNHNFICKYISPKHLVYLSDVLKDAYHSYYNRYHNTTIHMGGDFYKAYSSDKINLLKETYQIDHTFVFLSLGRLSKQKNHAMLFQALQRIKDRDFVCLIAGSGPLEEELKALASRYSLNDKVRFIGHTDKIEELLNLSDMLVQASFFEGFPNVFIEAASIGIPIVATNVGSSKTLIKENGILVPPNSVEAFAEALLLMMKNHEKYKTAAVTMSNSDFLKQFHKESMLQNYLSYYRELL